MERRKETVRVKKRKGMSSILLVDDAKIVIFDTTNSKLREMHRRVSLDTTRLA
jgi:hypothetical protein